MPQDAQYTKTATNPTTGQKMGYDPAKGWVAIPGAPLGVSTVSAGPTGLQRAEGMAKDALPYIGAGAATMLQPEAGIPMDLALATGGAAAGSAVAGAADKGIKGIAQDPGGFATDVAEDAVTKGTLPEAGGMGVSAILGKAFKASPVPQFIRDYLTKRGINMTAGELSGPGSLATMENVGSAVAAATSITDKFVTTRQQALGKMLNDTGKAISDAFDQAPAGSAVVRQGESRSVQEVAQTALDSMDSAKQMANDKLAATMSGKAGMTPAEAGDVIMQAVRGTYDAADDETDKLYEQLKPNLQGVTTTWTNSGPAARQILLKALRAENMGGSPLPQDLVGALAKVAGVTGITKDTITSKTPVGSFDAAWGARRSFGRMIGKLEGQGIISREDYGAYKRIYDTMTRDMLGSLPPETAAQFTKAMNATSAFKEQFNTKLLQSMLRTDKPLASEKVFANVMQSGNETDLQRLTSVISSNPDAIKATRRAAVEWLFKSSRDDAQALNLLEKRPGLKSLFGAQYDALKQELANRVQASMSPQAKLESKFLEKVASVGDVNEVAKSALKSDEYAANTADLTRHNALVHRDIATTMYNQLVDSSTKNGPYGAPGAYFSPTDFARNWAIQRPKFQKFLAPEVVSDLDKMSEAMGKLTFDVKPGVASKFRSLAELSAIGAGALTATIGLMTGSTTAVRAGVTVPLAAIYGPRMFVKMALSPTGARLLAEGVKIPLSSPQAQAWTMRVMGYLAKEATEDNETNKPAQQPNAPLAPGTKVALGAP